MPRKKATIDYEEGSGNIFADLDFPILNRSCSRPA